MRVQEALSVFLAGLGGVFVGMALLYTSIRVTALVTDRLARSKENDD